MNLPEIKEIDTTLHDLLGHPIGPEHHANTFTPADFDVVMGICLFVGFVLCADAGSLILKTLARNWVEDR